MKRVFFACMFLSLIPICGYAATADEYYNAGFTDYQVGKWGESISYLEAATQQNPNYWQAYQLLAYDYYRTNDIQKCIQNCDASLQINPNNSALQNFVDKLKVQDLPAPSVQNSPNNPSGDQTNGNTNESPAMAQPVLQTSEVYNSFYFNFSGVAPDSPEGFSTDWGAGGSLGVAYGFGLNKMTSIVFSAQYSTFPLTLTYPGLTLSGGGIHTLMFLVNGKFILIGQGNPVAFYLIAGLGPSEFISDALTGTNNSTGQTATETTTAFSETDFALRLGIGIDIRLNNGIALYLESNGVDTFVSPRVTSDGYISNGMFSLGMKFDN